MKYVLQDILRLWNIQQFPKLRCKDQNNMYALHEHLKNALHNNQFILKEEVVERPKEVVLYTDKQKFEKMVEDNPNVANIKESLNLQLDI